MATRAALNDGLPPIGLTAIRAVMATVLLVALAAAAGRKIELDRGSLRIGTVMGIFNLTVPFLLTTYALRYASAGFVGFMIALIPLSTALIAHYLLPDEPLHMRKVMSLMVALTGVGLLLLSGDSGLATGGRPMLAAGLTGVAVVAIGYAGVYAKRVAGAYNAITLTTTQFGIGALMSIPVALVTEGMPHSITTHGWLVITYLAVVSSIVPFLLFYWLLRHVSSTGVAMIAYLVPLVGLFAGIVLLDEQLQTGIAVGGLLILAGVVLTGHSERALARAAAMSSTGPLP